MEFQKLGIDGFLITNHHNKRYVSGFTGSTSEVIISENRKIFITDGRYKTQAKKEINSDFEILFAENQVSYFEKIVSVIKDAGFKTVGIEGTEMSIAAYQNLEKALPGVEFKVLGSPITESRIIKSAAEITKIKDVVKITDQAFANILPQIVEGMTEKELGRIVDGEHNKAGGEYPSFDSIVAFGTNTAKPHAHPGEKKLAVGDIITIDFGTFKNGYCSDMTRTFFFKAPKEQKLIEIHDIVKKAMELQMEAVKPGVLTEEIDRIGRDYITEHGYGEYFVHGTGHGIGLEVHEAPRIIQNNKTELKVGMVFTIEPGIYVENLGGVRIENDILVTATGCEILNTAPREWDLLK